MKTYVCATKCCSKLIYQTLPDKQVVYVLPSMITSILGRLPVVQAGDTGTIQFKYRTRCKVAATVPIMIDTTIPSPGLTQDPGQGTEAPCTS